MSPAAGAQRLVAGRYALDRRLGAGGMAEVYLARDLETGRLVALKLLAAPQAADQRVVARFEHEARAAAAIDHPNVVAVLGSGADDGTHYIAMEYVPGPNLKELLRQRGRLPEDEALPIAEQVAAALGAAHARGVVHLDVKPHNVLLTPDGAVKVADFGIARALQAGAADATLTTPIGTAPYVSPEQAQGRRVDARSDLYSLGALLYELLTGRPPFEGESPLAVALRHINEPPRPPRELRPELSRAAEAIVLRALAKSPDDRFASAPDMRAAIAAARLGADPGLAHTVPLAAPPLDATRVLPRPTPPIASAPASSNAPFLAASSAAPSAASAAAHPPPTAAAGRAAAPPTAPRRRRWLPLALALALLAAAPLTVPRLLARSSAPAATATVPAATATVAPLPTATAPPKPTAVPSPTPPPPSPTAVRPTPTTPPPTPTAVPPTPTRPPPTATHTPPPKAPVVNRPPKHKGKSREED